MLKNDLEKAVRLYVENSSFDINSVLRSALSAFSLYCPLILRLEGEISEETSYIDLTANFPININNVYVNGEIIARCDSFEIYTQENIQGWYLLGSLLYFVKPIPPADYIIQGDFGYSLSETDFAIPPGSEHLLILECVIYAYQQLLALSATKREDISEGGIDEIRRAIKALRDELNTEKTQYFLCRN